MDVERAGIEPAQVGWQLDGDGTEENRDADAAVADAVLEVINASKLGGVYE